MDIKYFDHAATTKIKKEVLDEMTPYLKDEYGNPSSSHIKGINAKAAIEKSREKIAECINAHKEEIYFTSGGTEADNIAIKGFARANKKKGNHIITTQIEHKAILESCKALEDEGFEITYIAVDKYGVVKVKELEEAIKETTILISVMFANNEIGTIEPIKEIGEIARRHNIVFHTDAVQAVGNLKIDVKELNIDMLSMSAHKFYGPKGTGCLYVKKDIAFNPIMNGGGQERGMRSGTENVASIVGMGKALEIATHNVEEYNTHLNMLKETFLIKLNEKNSKIKMNGHPIKRLKGNVNITFENVDAESLLLLLSKEGLCISIASACGANAKKVSHVLKAIGLNDEEARGTIRISFGEENTKRDVEVLAERIKNIVGKMHEM